MAPFSLNELGLSDDEIASLGLAAAPAEAAAEPTAPEPAIPPVASEPPVEPIAEPPAASAPPVAPESPTAAAPARPPRMAEAAQITSTGNDVLDAFLRQLEGDPDNDVLRLSVARVVGQIGMPDLALKQYRYLVKHNRMLDQVAGELQDLIAYSDDPRLLPGLHRVLGDVYSKQGRLREAIDEYSWTLGGPRGTR